MSINTIIEYSNLWLPCARPAVAGGGCGRRGRGRDAGRGRQADNPPKDDYDIWEGAEEQQLVSAGGCRMGREGEFLSDTKTALGHKAISF